MADWLPWATAIRHAMTGPGAFYLHHGVPARHFRTSVIAAPDLMARAVAILLADTWPADPEPDRAPPHVVDIGAGGGELLSALAVSVPTHVRLHGVDVAPRPSGLAESITWSDAIPPEVDGIVIANEYLDDVPIDVAEVAPDGHVRLVLVDPATGAERLGDPVDGEDAAWLAQWWPLEGQPPGARAEIGRSRDVVWVDVVARVRRGVVLAIDYDHAADRRPYVGTLTGYRAGRVVRAVPDGSCNVTAHVALDACAAAGLAAGAASSRLLRQADALRALGLVASVPPIDLARSDPAGYLRELARAGSAAELLDPSGLGGFGWLVQTVGLDVPSRLERGG